MAERRRRARPLMRVVAEEIKPVLAFLERELQLWPQVALKPMFGMWGVYRGNRIFAALPRSRSLGTPHSILCKLPRDKKPSQRGQGWKPIEIFSSADLRATLDCLHRAYQQAGERKQEAGDSPASKRKGAG